MHQDAINFRHNVEAYDPVVVINPRHPKHGWKGEVQCVHRGSSVLPVVVSFRNGEGISFDYNDLYWAPEACQ